MISVVCVYNNEKILKDNLLKSLENQTSKHELILIDNTQGKFESAAGALNWGGGKAKGKYIMFVYQHVDLCSNSWLENVEKLLNSIPNLGIAGVVGARRSDAPRMVETVTNIKHGIPPVNVNTWDQWDPLRFRKIYPGAVPLQKPEKVQTVDECLVIIPRPVFDMLQFDEEVCDDWHLLYAVDYSLSVARLGLDVYVIPASIHHGSTGKSNENVLQLISSMGSFPAGYYRILGKLLKKHRSHTKQVYGTTGCWSTSYPLILHRVEEVRFHVYHQILGHVYHQIRGKVLRILGTMGIVSRPRNAFKRILSAVKHLPDSDAQKLDRARIAAMYLQGEGIEIGALHAPLEVPTDVRVRYVDRLPEDGLRQQHPEYSNLPFVRIDIVDDGQKLSLIDDDSQDFVIANGVLEHFENPLLSMQNMLRVVKEGGIIYMSVPDKRYTFDLDRPVTPLKHLFRDYNGQPDRIREADFEEFARQVDKIKGEEAVKQWAKNRYEKMDYSIHFHVWTQIEILELLVAVKRRMTLPFDVELIYCMGYEVIVILRKSARFTPRTSKVEEVTLPAESGNILFSIGFVQDFRKGRNEFIDITGWAFIAGQSSENSQIHVVLECGVNTYVFDTARRKKPEVTTLWGKMNLNLDDSGFFARIPKEEVEKATYRVGIYIKKGSIEALRYSDIEIDFRP